MVVTNYFPQHSALASSGLDMCCADIRERSVCVTKGAKMLIRAGCRRKTRRKKKIII